MMIVLGAALGCSSSGGGHGLLGAAGNEAAGTGADAAGGSDALDNAPVAGSDGGAVTDATDATEAGAPPSAINAVLRGAGCGKPLPADQPVTIPGKPFGYRQHSVMLTGRILYSPTGGATGTRTFWVRVPADYDPNKAYRTVYLGQGCGTPGNANNETYRLFDEAKGGTEQAIYVALDVPAPAGGGNYSCYDTMDVQGSQEWETFSLAHTLVDSTYCVDNNRVFVAGYSAGGDLANMLGCYFAGDGQMPANSGVPRNFVPKYHLRGQAVVATPALSGLTACNGPAAAFFLRDADDPAVARLRSLDGVGARNGCSTNIDAPATLEPWHPEIAAIGGVCQRFKGCPADYPVVVCTTTGLGHSAQEALFVPAVKLFFDEIGQPR